MLRVSVVSILCALLICNCGPDKRTCSGEEPAFRVVLKLANRPLPADTVVHVTYAGSGKEDFRLSHPDARLEVTFCRTVDENGMSFDASGAAPAAGGGSAEALGAAGAGGAAGALEAASDEDDSRAVTALACDLWTAGFTGLKVSGTGFATVEYELTPKQDRCTVEKAFVLDSPDAG